MTFRLSQELRDRLAAAAGDRPIGDEIRQRLERSFGEPSGGATDPRFTDILRSLGYTAAATAQLYPGDDPRGTSVFHEAARRLVALFLMEKGMTPFDDDMRGDVTGVMLLALGKLDAPPEFIRKVMAQMSGGGTKS